MAADLHSDRLLRGRAPVAEVGFDELARRADGLPLREFLSIAEAWRIARALRDHRGNRSAAARALGIGRRTLYTKMEKLGLVPTWTLGGAAPPIAASRAQRAQVARSEPKASEDPWLGERRPSNGDPRGI